MSTASGIRSVLMFTQCHVSNLFIYSSNNNNNNLFLECLISIRIFNNAVTVKSIFKSTNKNVGISFISQFVCTTSPDANMLCARSLQARMYTWHVNNGGIFLFHRYSITELQCKVLLI